MKPQENQQSDQVSSDAQARQSSAPTDQSQSANTDQPQVVYMARPLEPHRQTVSQESQQKHEDSKKQYPQLNLSEGEYVITAIKRHPIGLIGIWVSVILVIVVMFGGLAFLMNASNNGDLGTFNFPVSYLVIPAFLIALLAATFGFIGTYVYNMNRFYLTNESVIQNIQNSLFSNRQQTISLANVEDASYSKDGIVQHIFDYGLLRLSTQGDETTYRFNYASSPENQIRLLNNAVENFKNVRPIE